MIKVENIATSNWEGTIRGLRNPMNSWDKSDTDFSLLYKGVPAIGINDINLMVKLAASGSDDRKYMRQIFVCMDITAPLYWWKEMDQYKVGTVTNSCSTMHKIASVPLTMEDFSTEHLTNYSRVVLNQTIQAINEYRADYVSLKDKKYWYQMIQLLPSSYNQKRTWTANYEVLKNIYNARKNHKLDEWKDFCKVIETMPYSDIITGPREEISLGEKK